MCMHSANTHTLDDGVHGLNEPTWPIKEKKSQHENPTIAQEACLTPSCSGAVHLMCTQLAYVQAWKHNHK